MGKKIINILFIVFSMFVCIKKVYADTVMYVGCSEIPFDVVYDQDKELNGYIVKITAREAIKNKFITDNKLYGVINLNENTNLLINILDFGDGWINEESGKCPLYCDIPIMDAVCYETSNSTEVYVLGHARYAFFKNDDGNIISYSYSENGKCYTYKDGTIFNSYSEQRDTIFLHQTNYWEIDNSNYFYQKGSKYYPFSDVNKKAEARTVIFNSDSKIDELHNQIDNWIKENNIIAADNKNDFSTKYSTLINQCNVINKRVANGVALNTNGGSSRFDYNSIYNNLNNAISETKTTFKDNDTTNYLNDSYTYAMNKFFGTGSIDKIGDYAEDLVKKSITDYLKSKGIYDVTAEAEDYTKTLYTCANNIMNNASDLGLNNDIATKYGNLDASYKELLEDRGYTVVENCEDLLGDDLIGIINEYMGYIRIIVPILVIALGMIDLFKAVIASEEGEMKKAQKTFIKRLIIGMALFLIPTFISLLLGIINDVWGFVGTGTCGIF